MNKKIIITGATGLIGKKISAQLISRGYSVIIFSRSPENAKSVVHGASDYVHWDYNNNDNLDWIKYLEEADAVIHLAGENVMAERWNDKHKKSILNSRVLGTRSLVNAISKLNVKPKVFISASAIGYYGASKDTVFTENSNPGTDFLAQVTAKWEAEVINIREYGVREVRVRIGMVLDKNEGALPKMTAPYKLFAGGPLGSGKQWMSWIHIDDVTGIFMHALNNQQVSGALNAVAQAETNMKQFSSILGKVLHRPSIFKVPSFLIKLMVGEAAYLVTEGARVIPQAVKQSGYTFIYNDLEKALKDIYN